MIYRCQSGATIKEILDYIGDDYKKIPYLYMDTVKYGTGAPNVRTWVDRASNGSLQGIYLFYYDCLHFFTKDSDHYPMETLLNAIEFLSPHVMIAPDSVGCLIEKQMLQDWDVDKSYIIDMDKVGLDYCGLPCDLASREDIQEIANLMMMSNIYTGTYNHDTLEAQMLSRYDEGFSRYYVIRENQKIVAAFSTFGETAAFVALGGLVVHPDYRGKGYASRIERYVCHLFFKEGVSTIGFVSDKNTASLNLHRKIGAFPIALQFKFMRKQG